MNTDLCKVRKERRVKVLTANTLPITNCTHTFFTCAQKEFAWQKETSVTRQDYKSQTLNVSGYFFSTILFLH